jgi:hypothetical protein
MGSIRGGTGWTGKAVVAWIVGVDAGGEPDQPQIRVYQNALPESGIAGLQMMSFNLFDQGCSI